MCFLWTRGERQCLDGFECLVERALGQADHLHCAGHRDPLQPGQFAPLKGHFQHLMVVVGFGERKRQRRAAVVHPLGRALGQMEVTERRVVGTGKEFGRQGVLVAAEHPPL